VQSLCLPQCSELDHYHAVEIAQLTDVTVELVRDRNASVRLYLEVEAFEIAEPHPRGLEAFRGRD
jgi:hypothetical protein